MYEESLRMPFLVRWPGAIKAGTRSDAIALNVDFAPTFLAAAGMQVPEAMQGRSLLPVLRGRTPAELDGIDPVPFDRAVLERAVRPCGRVGRDHLSGRVAIARRGAEMAACLVLRHPDFTSVVPHGPADGLDRIIERIVKSHEP